MKWFYMIFFIYDTQTETKIYKKQIQGVQQQNDTECDIPRGLKA